MTLGIVCVQVIFQTKTLGSIHASLRSRIRSTIINCDLFLSIILATNDGGFFMRVEGHFVVLIKISMNIMSAIVEIPARLGKSSKHKLLS